MSYYHFTLDYSLSVRHINLTVARTLSLHINLGFFCGFFFLFMFLVCHRCVILFVSCSIVISWGRLDLAVLFTPSTPNRQNRNQVRWNTRGGLRLSTPSSKVVQTEQPRDLFQNKMA